MSGRSSFATPTNVYPKNGQVVVFNKENEIPMSFTNNTDSLTFFMYEFYNVDTDENIVNFIKWYYDHNEPLLTNARNESLLCYIHNPEQTLPDSGGTYYPFYAGGHYSYDIIQCSAFPKEIDGDTVFVPNINVKMASGKLLEVSSNSRIKIAPDLDIHPPLYFGKVGEEEGEPIYGFRTYPNILEYIARCSYISIYGKQMMIVGYDPFSGWATLFESITPIIRSHSDVVSNLSSGMPYSIYCNYISSSGASSEGVYDFYVRSKIETASNADPVPGSFRCLATYNHLENIGLEKYRFRIYQLYDNDNSVNNYINGTIRKWENDDSNVNKGADYKRIPITKNLYDLYPGLNLVNKRIIIGKENEATPIISGDWGEIMDYDNQTGIITVRREMEVYPWEGLPYTIELEDRILVADSGDCYSWKLAYNFPIYLLGSKIQLETILTSYEKQVSDTCTTITLPAPELHYDYGQDNNEYSIVSNNENQTVELTFKESISSDDRFFGLYRRTRSSVMDDHFINKWDYIGFIREGNTFTDYLAANNTTYDYLISKTVTYIDPYEYQAGDDILHFYDYDAANEYAPCEFNNAVSTKWDGWTITAIYPCENDYIVDPIESIKTSNGLNVMYGGEYKDTVCQFVCSKTPYKVGDTWHFYSAIDSGEIVSNLNRNVHVGTSIYPTISGTNNKYQSGTFTTDLVTLECSTDKIYDNIEKVNKWLKFITDDCLYILKSDKGDVWIVAISDNPSRSYDESVEDIITKASYSWTEVDSPDNIQIVQY